MTAQASQFSSEARSPNVAEGNAIDRGDRLAFQAYGWDDLIPQWQQTQIEPNNPEIKEKLEQSILQRLVDLNAERAEEERNELVRLLRPEYQAPDQIATQKVIEGVGVAEDTEEIIASLNNKNSPPN